MVTTGEGAHLTRRGDVPRWFDVTISLSDARAVGTVPLHGPTAFVTKRLTPLPGRPPFRVNGGHPLVLWVHGFNNTGAEALYRHVQMAEDIGMAGPQVSFVWPSAQNVRGYLHDRDSVLDARRPLADVIRNISQSWPGEVFVIAHSLGAFLTMEALGRLSRDGHSVPALVDGLVLMQPDIDPHVFREQTYDIGTLPGRAVVVLAQDDRALTISGLFAGTRSRVGNSPSTVPEDFDILDLTGVEDAGTSHLVALSSPMVLAELSRLYASQINGTGRRARR